jgi:adiponectin receptor
MFGSYGIGFLFFVTRFPERLFPGTFDYIGTSHQIWHVFVWIAGFAWCEGMREYLRWRHTVNTPLCELVAA